MLNVYTVRDFRKKLSKILDECDEDFGRKRVHISRNGVTYELKRVHIDDKETTKRVHKAEEPQGVYTSTLKHDCGCKKKESALCSIHGRY